MTDIELKRLQLNLTRSAIKAKKFYLRGMIGNTESDQGFFPIQVIPVFNPIQNKETVLQELIEDIGKLNDEHKELQLAHIALKQDSVNYKEAQIEVQKENKKVTDALEQRLNAIEAFRID